MKSQVPLSDSEIEIQLYRAALHRAGYRAQPDIAFLVDALQHRDVAIWSYAQHILYRIVPMASLYERWNDPPLKRTNFDPGIPVWIRERCADWGSPNDFSDICAQRLIAARQKDDRDLLMDRLAMFHGADQIILDRLKSYGQEALMAEFAIQAEKFRKSQFPLQLTIMPTMACQLNCRYCYSAGIRQTSENTMSLSDMLHLLDWARASGITRICLAGGEPTLFPHLHALIDYMQSYGMTYFLATNGLYAVDVAERLKATPPLSVSLHMNSEIYRSTRLERFIFNCRSLVQGGVLTAIRFNLTAPCEEFYDYLDLCSLVGIRDIRLAVPVPNFDHTNMFVSAAELQSCAGFIDQFVSTALGKGIDVHLSKPFPVCALAEKTAQLFIENGSYNACCQVHMQRCSYNLTVYPDFLFAPCLSLNRKSDRSILAYADVFCAAQTYCKEVIRLSHVPFMDKCRGCPLSRGGRCVGGCLSYRARTSESDRSSRPL